MATRSLNKVMLIGNLTRDPNLRFTPGGTAVCSFGLATNRTWVNSDSGDREEKVDFHNVVAWGKLAEICGQLLHKGDKVFVEGRLQTRDWKGNDGTDRRVTEVVIDNMIMLYSSSGGGASDDYQGDDSSSNSSSSYSQSDDQTASDDVQDVEDVSDDIPF